MNDERKRMRRDEMNAVIYFRCALAAAGYCVKELGERFAMIPDGEARFTAALGAFSDLTDEIIATAPEESERRLANITHDFKIVLAPKPQTEPKVMILRHEDAETVMDAALKTCGDCYRSDDEARRTCRLYKVMETYCPLNDYGNGMICQYGKRDIE